MAIAASSAINFISCFRYRSFTKFPSVLPLKQRMPNLLPKGKKN